MHAQGPSETAESGGPSRIDHEDAATGTRISVLRAPGGAWAEVSAALEAAGASLPIDAEPGFPGLPGERRVLLAVSAGGAWRWGAVAEVGRSRAVPWKTIVRVLRLGRGIGRDEIPSVVAVLELLGRTENALRLDVEISHPDAGAREHLLAGLQAAGFAMAAVPRMYAITVLIDLQRSEEDLFASFHATGRRHVRGFAKHPLQCVRLTDGQYAGRLAELDDETMRRTDGPRDAFDWSAMLRFAASAPERAAVFGVIRTDATDPAAALVGYVLGVRHGDTIEYRRAASTRLSDLKAPLLYAPTWELLRWGQAIGAHTFDFGGIGDGSWASGTATGGIADFKRYFSDVITEVGAEVTLSPAPVTQALAQAAARGARLVRTALRRR